ncbi:nitrate reductase [Motiliproteus coralliicola]|uniref:Nitrate reductase n=1 Tax=Motiliproteus coralliicola TaxID=2283196 RepID=A0A369WAL6_9GAMM|nr:nitrate reductase [Motiliproteus coralliicola]RDE18219.1 nitrate reductase [Motiliproteus coralliicola]
MTMKTTCPYCGVGCGLTVETDKVGGLSLSGDTEHPANFGRLCVKGSALGQTLGEAGRLHYPQVDGQRQSWQQALDQVSERLQRTILEHGPDSVAFYLSGQLLTEDYYVANKLMKGFIGSANVDTNSRLCMSSAVAGYKRALGADAVPCNYEDIELADLVVLVGSNAAWNHPVLFQRLSRAKANRPEMKVVVIDPRRTATSELADLQLSLRPGSDISLFNGLFDYLVEQGEIDSDFVQQHTEGFEAAWAQVRNQARQNRAESDCDLDSAELKQFYQWFADSPKTVTLFSQGVNQSSHGVDNANAIINCHLLTGRIGKPGAGPFSITGQPNAMGGREVGGLANQLAAHMGFDRADQINTVARFWKAPNIATQPGLMAVPLIEAIERGQVKAIWIMGTNPVVSLPDSDRVARALAGCETVIVSDCVADTDTSRTADILLPALGWSEKDGTVTNSERRISRQRGLLPPCGEAKPDWWILSQVAQRLGYGKAFAYQSPVEIFREHAALSGFENRGERIFDISALAQLDQQQYDALQPIQWPVTAACPEGTPRLFADGRFVTPNGKARMLAVSPSKPKQQPDKQHPWIINSGRIRDQWHTMTRTALAAPLFQHRQEPFIEIHPDDAKQQQLAEGALARLHNAQGRFVGRLRFDEGLRRGNLFVPMHWNQQFCSQGRSGALMAPVTDPLSGQPESKHGVAALQPFEQRWQACLFVREPLETEPEVDYWARTPLVHSQLYRLAGEQAMADWPRWCRQAMGQPTLWLADAQQGQFRAAGIQQGQLQWLLLVIDSEQRIDPDWVDQMFALASLDRQQRRRLLSGRDCQAEPKGAVVCSCFQVGQRQIEAAVSAGADSVEQLGHELRCGTNCGSCVPELQQLLEVGALSRSA